MKNKKPSILEVAKLAGVSPATVSRILNNNPRVDPELKKRVLEASQKLGYRLNYYAKALIQGKTNFIGLLLTKFAIRHYSSILYGIESVLNKAGYKFFVTSSRYDREKEKEKIQLFLDLNFAGIIIIPVGLSDAEIVEFSKKGTPIVVYDRLVRGLEENCIYFDNFGIEEKITNYLIECGHRKIALIAGSDSLPVYRERKNGYISALKKHGISVDESLIYTCDMSGFSTKEGYNSALELLKRGHFTALVCQNDQTAIGAISAIHSMGLKVPEDISVVGFGNVPEAPYTLPSLTTISFDRKKIGNLIGQKIISVIENKPLELEIPEFKIIYRSSVKILNKKLGVIL